MIPGQAPERVVPHYMGEIADLLGVKEERLRSIRLTNQTMLYFAEGEQTPNHAATQFVRVLLSKLKSAPFPVTLTGGALIITEESNHVDA